jgi:DNA (cytosine-5)-methyltransferase 1
VQKDNLVLEYVENKRSNELNVGDVSKTLCTGENDLCKEESMYRIRKLTPKECWRLMGFTDEDFEAAEGVNSNTQLYKQAGNSIVKQVLMALFGEMVE